MKTKIIFGIMMLLFATIGKAQDSGEINVPLSKPGSKGSLYGKSVV